MSDGVLVPLYETELDVGKAGRDASRIIDNDDRSRSTAVEVTLII